MSEPTEAQQRWFWEQCGLRYECYDTPAMPNVGSAWIDSKGGHANPEEPSEPPRIDLNNLFKYAMSSLDQANYYKALRSIFLKHDDPALALFWAIYKVFGGEE